MAVVRGCNGVVLVTERGDVWTYKEVPERDTRVTCVTHPEAGVEIYDGERIFMVAAGCMHYACVSAKGSVFTWGRNEEHQLGTTFEPVLVGHNRYSYRQSTTADRPVRLDKTLFGASPAVMVACGGVHTVVLTAAGGVWTFGQTCHTNPTGHGTNIIRVPTLIPVENFDSVPIVMVAAGQAHTVVLGDDGRVWTCGSNRHGQQGRVTQQGRDRVHAPALLDALPSRGGAAQAQAAGACATDDAVVLVAADGDKSAAVTHRGALWVWPRHASDSSTWHPVRVGTDSAFRGSPVLMVACAQSHWLVVCEDGALWKVDNGTLLQTCIGGPQFGQPKFVTVSAYRKQSFGVTEDGELYTWGQPDERWAADELPRLTLRQVGGARIGPCHSLSQMQALAFAMGTHCRLGASTAGP